MKLVHIIVQSLKCCIMKLLTFLKKTVADIFKSFYVPEKLESIFMSCFLLIIAKNTSKLV